jgi:hypothetical protein
MKVLRCVLAVAVAVASAAAVPAADLSKVERTIAKEPTYKGKPKYCLLVFGPEAAHRVWLVQDGDTLYVDRNGNGDLTEPGEKVAAEKDERNADGEYTFKAGDVTVGAHVHKLPYVIVTKLDVLAESDEGVKEFHAKNPQARGYTVQAEIEMPGWKGTGVGGRVVQRAFYLDAHGVLQFADSPREAPVVHFGADSWQVTLFGRHTLTRGRQADVVLGVGTPGVGPGTTAFIDYGGVIPEKMYPTLDITYPPKQPGEPPVREHYELKQRC